MARKLCARALEIKASYERTTPEAKMVAPERAALYKGTQYGDRRAYARAMEGHMRKCRLCS